MTENTNRRFKLAEVAQHKTEKDCWIVVDGKVLDITPFLSQHPGGDDILLEGGGTDLTSEFEDTGHSADARKQMEKYIVGLVDEEDLKQKKATKTASASEINPAVIIAVIVAILAALFLLLKD